jgi:rod shape-determining protein MreD
VNNERQAMQFLLIPVVVYVAAVIETSLIDGIRIGPVAPDLLALVALVWLLGPRRGTWTIAVAGMIALVGDLIAPGRVGVGAFWMLLLGYAVVQWRIRFRHEHLVLQVITVGVAVTAWAVAVGLTNRLLGELPLSMSSILMRSVGVGVYTAGVGLPVLMVVGWVRQPGFAYRAKAAEL